MLQHTATCCTDEEVVDGSNAYDIFDGTHCNTLQHTATSLNMTYLIQHRVDVDVAIIGCVAAAAAKSSAR